MGNAQCGPAVRTMERQISLDIEQELQRQGRFMHREHKVLFLGPSSVGKSTVAKLFKLIHLNGFTRSELLGFKPIVHWNLLEMIQTLIYGCRDELEIEISGDYQALAEEIENLGSIETQLDREIAGKLIELCGCVAIQRAYGRRREVRMADWAPSSLEELVAKIRRCSEPDYMPSVQDMLAVRTRTTGIFEMEFDIRADHIRCIDVGGPRSERRKWIHCFSDVSAILFLVSFAKIGEMLYHDNSTSEWDYQIPLLTETLCCKFWQNCMVILVGTHVDSLARDQSPSELVLQLLRQSVNPSDPELLRRLALREAPVHVIPDTFLLDIDRSAVHLDSVVKLVLRQDLPSEVVTSDTRISGLNDPVYLHRHPSALRRSWWQFQAILKFRPEALSGTPLTRDVVSQIERFVFS